MRFGAVGERSQQISQLRIAVLLGEPRRPVAPLRTAGFAHERQTGRATFPIFYPEIFLPVR